jgi:hypothetical protein
MNNLAASREVSIDFFWNHALRNPDSRICASIAFDLRRKRRLINPKRLNMVKVLIQKYPVPAKAGTQFRSAHAARN